MLKRHYETTVHPRGVLALAPLRSEPRCVLRRKRRDIFPTLIPLMEAHDLTGILRRFWRDLLTQKGAHDLARGDDTDDEGYTLEEVAAE